MKIGAVEKKILEPGEYPAKLAEVWIGLKDYENRQTGVNEWYPSLCFVYDLEMGEQRFEYLTLYFDDNGNLEISKISKLYDRLKALVGAFKVEQVELESDVENVSRLLKFPDESHKAVLKVKGKNIVGRQCMVIIEHVTTKRNTKAAIVKEIAPMYSE